MEELHSARDYADGLLLNPGAWTHYAWALRDALEVSGLPAVEVHLSDVKHREPFRAVSVLEDVCVATVSGAGTGRLPDGAGAAEGGAGVSRADRVAARLAEREARPAARHRPRQRALPHRLHRLRTGSPSSGPSTRRFLTDFRYVERAKAEVDGFDLEPAPQRPARPALAEGWPDGPVRLGFEDQHVSVRRHAELRETLPGAGRARGRRRPGRGRARGQGAGRAGRDPRGRGARRRGLRVAGRARAGRADGARGRARARARDARPRRRRPELPVDRRRARERRAAARHAARRPDPARTRSSRSTSARAWTATARTARGRGRRASSRTTSRSSTPRSCRRRTRRWPPSGRA